MIFRLRAVVLTVVCITASSLALAFSGQVVGVADGDTLTVVDSEQRQYKIRLTEIDAPEKRQAFGQRSKQNLADLCFGREAIIDPQTADRYGRIVAKIRCSGIDASTEQVRLGMAWVYDRYVKDRSLYRIQAEAKAAGLGLWADADPSPPWEWRRKEKR